MSTIPFENYLLNKLSKTDYTPLSMLVGVQDELRALTLVETNDSNISAVAERFLYNIFD